ncbi:hypothetical protein J9317_18380 [Metabacillus sp. KIGAM252]|uniref:Copper amine oxidase-like N-terminal domain-containing protein n=1 Tax=Metabacillus flavus TaxID=2823519 RepID=A0ABS5LK24_9BACI|nr:stalk domain-containing protein [Metabacillus flavus]MBS2970714.1 hypothetical protein [Metabacillus flavus]
MRRELTSLVIASAVLAGSAFSPVAINEAKAASAVQQTMKESVYVNGKQKVVHATVVGKTKLHSVSDLAKALSAKVMYDKKSQYYVVSKGSGKDMKTIKVKSGSSQAFVNGKKVKLENPPAMAGKTLFMAAKNFVHALGGDLLIDANLLISEKGMFKTSTFKMNVEGKLHSAKTLRVNGKYLYSVQDIAKAYSAKVTVKGTAVTLQKGSQTATFKIYQNSITANGETVNLSAYPVSVKGVIYADLMDMVKALGGQMEKMDTGRYMLFTSKLVSGDSYNPAWVGSHVMVTNEDENASRTYLMDVNTRQVMNTINATDVVVSPDGMSAIHSDETGVITLIDLTTGTSRYVSLDDDIKVDFVWAQDGKKAYFIKGEKNDKIFSVDIATGALKEVPSDSKIYKTDLRLSADGTKLLYVVSKEAETKTTDTGDGGTDVTDILTEGTEPQFFTIDLTAKTPAATAITTTKDNKVYPAFLKDGSIVYLSAMPDSEDLPVLTMIRADNTVSQLVKDKDILFLTVTQEGKLMILTSENNMSVIYEVNPSEMKLTKIASTPLEITSFAVSKDGQVAATAPGLSGERLVVWKNGSFEIVTK